ncbi:MAG: hypothetical protein QW035_01315 [Candidatus Anstonellales archaeon]
MGAWDLKDVIERLAGVSQLYPPIEIFQNTEDDVRGVIKRMLKKGKMLEEKEGELVNWLKTMIPEIGKRLSLIFYGRAVYGCGKQPPLTDIDVLVEIKDDSALKEIKIMEAVNFPHKPIFLHVNTIEKIKCNHKAEELALSWRKLCFANTLLLACEDPGHCLLGFIEKSRKALMESPFFNGGIGELITYAAYKVVYLKEKEFFSKGFDTNEVFFKSIKTPYIDIDMCYDLLMHNKEVREELANRFEEEEIKEITSAALRRIGVKKELREGIKSKFVEEIRKLKK